MARRKNRNNPRRKQPKGGSKTAETRDAVISGKAGIQSSKPATQQPLLSLSGRDIPLPLAALALCLLVAVSFFPATGAGLVWDDVVLTQARPIQALSGLWQIWFEPRSLTQFEGHYWPILYTTFWLEHKLWGFDPAGYHIVNLLLHAAITLLLWRLLRRLGVPGAWFAAAVFAVHPLHVESVTWVIGRKDLLATLFSLACVLSYLRSFDDGARLGVDRHRWHYVLALALFVLRLLSKSIVITLPVSLLIWHWWKQARVTGADLVRVLPFLLLGLGITFADLSFYKGRDTTAFDYSLIERALIAAQALWFYVGKLLWPTGLAVIYPRWEVGVAAPLAWGYLFATVATPALLWFYRGRIGRGPLAGALFFVVTLSPTLGFVDFGYMLYSFVADRYQYLAGAGVIVTLVAVAAQGAGKLQGASRIGTQVMAALLLLVLGTIPWKQAGIYRDNVTFYSHVIALNPTARFAHQGLAQEYEKQERYEEALAAYRTDQALAPQQPSPEIRISKAYTDMGRVAEAQGRFNEAQAHYQQAVEITPRLPSAVVHLAAFWLKQKRHQEVLELFQTLHELSPGNANYYVGRGVALFGLNRLDEALRSYDRVLAMDPLLEQARSNRKNLLQIMKSNEK